MLKTAIGATAVTRDSRNTCGEQPQLPTHDELPEEIMEGWSLPQTTKQLVADQQPIPAGEGCAHS